METGLFRLMDCEVAGLRLCNPPQGFPLWRGVVLVALMGATLHITVGPALASLTPDQESLARSIEGKVMAPCCWTQTVADRQSDIAEQMKAEIRNLIAQGRSEDEILDQYHPLADEAVSSLRTRC